MNEGIQQFFIAPKSGSALLASWPRAVILSAHCVGDRLTQRKIV